MTGEPPTTDWTTTTRMIGLVLFLAVFIAIVVGAIVMPRRSVQKRAQMPLTEGYEPVEPRDGGRADRGEDEPASDAEGTKNHTG